MSETRSVQVNLRLQPSLKDAAEAAAARDHRSLTSLVEKLLSEYVMSRPTLEDWHELAQARLASVLAEKNLADQLKYGTLAGSYALVSSGAERINPHQVIRQLREIHAVLERLLSAAQLVYPYTRSELAPYFTSDSKILRGHSNEILECVALPDVVETIGFWRVSATGLTTDIRPHFEDRKSFHDSPPARKFCPFFMTRHLAELVHHAYLLGEKFRTAERVAFRCEWTGLLEREVWDPDPATMMTWLPGKVARTDHCITEAEWSLKELRATWPEIISDLGGPVMRLFDPEFDYSGDWVRAQIPRLQRR